MKVNAVCPDYVATDLNYHSGPRTPEQDGHPIEMAPLLADGSTGGYFDGDGRHPGKLAGRYGTTGSQMAVGWPAEWKTVWVAFT